MRSLPAQFSCEIESQTVSRSLLEGHKEQVMILESVKAEIAAKIHQRRVALDRWFPDPLFSAAARSVACIDVLAAGIVSTRGRVDDIKQNLTQKRIQIAEKRLWLDACKAAALPRRSAIVKNLNFQLDSVSKQLALVSSELSSRRMALLRQLAELYPIEFHGNYRTIRDLALPNASGLKRCELRDEESVSTALGYLVHRTSLVACVLDVPLKLILEPCGSRSAVKDRFSVPSLQEFPLYFRNVERQRYLTAVHMLQDTLVHFNQFRTQKCETSTDLLELAEILLMRELLSSSF